MIDYELSTPTRKWLDHRNIDGWSQGTHKNNEYEYVYCDIAARRLDWDNQKCNKII